MTSLPRPPTATTMMDSITETNSKTLERDTKHPVPIKPANHTKTHQNHFYYQHHLHWWEHIATNNSWQDLIHTESATINNSLQGHLSNNVHPYSKIHHTIMLHQEQSLQDPTNNISTGNSPPCIHPSNNSDINKLAYKYTSTSGKTHPSNTLYLPLTPLDYQPKVKIQMKRVTIL